MGCINQRTFQRVNSSLISVYRALFTITDFARPEFLLNSLSVVYTQKGEMNKDFDIPSDGNIFYLQIICKVCTARFRGQECFYKVW